MDERKLILGIILLVLMSAFLWSMHAVMSPILIGGILLFLLWGVHEQFARRLIFAVILFLLFWLLFKVRSMILPFVAAMVLAYLFSPLVDRLESMKVRRNLAVTGILVITVGVLILFGRILLPNMIHEIQRLIGEIPQVGEKLFDMLVSGFRFLHVDGEQLRKSLLEEIPNRASLLMDNLLKGVTSVGAFMTQLFNLILIPVLTFYFLKDFNKINGWLQQFIPRKHRSLFVFYHWRLNRILGGYIRGQLIVCSVVGILTGLGLTLFKIPFAILLGLMTGLLNVIPFIGFYVSFGLCLLAAFFMPDVGPALVKISIVFLSVQAIEAYVVTPKIMSDRLGLHPALIIFSVLVFSRLLGFWGLIIAVPTAALIKYLVDEWERRKKWSEKIAEKTAAKNPAD